MQIVLSHVIVKFIRRLIGFALSILSIRIWCEWKSATRKKTLFINRMYTHFEWHFLYRILYYNSDVVLMIIQSVYILKCKNRKKIHNVARCLCAHNGVSSPKTSAFLIDQIVQIFFFSIIVKTYVCWRHIISNTWDYVSANLQSQFNIWPLHAKS